LRRPESHPDLDSRREGSGCDTFRRRYRKPKLLKPSADARHRKRLQPGSPQERISYFVDLLPFAVRAFFFECLSFLRFDQMIVHSLFGAVRIPFAYGTVDVVMLLRGLLQIQGPVHGLTPAIEEYRGHHIHQRRKNAIIRSSRDSLMKLHVVYKILLGIIQRGIHAGYLLGEPRHMLASGAACSKAGDAHFECKTCLEHFVRRKSVKGREHSQWRA